MGPDQEGPPPTWRGCDVSPTPLSTSRDKHRLPKGRTIVVKSCAHPHDSLYLTKERRPDFWISSYHLNHTGGRRRKPAVPARARPDVAQKEDMESLKKHV